LVQWDSSTSKLKKLHEGAHLSFGAIGKGYALDRVRALLEREGFTNYQLESGGSSLVFSGSDLGGAPWSAAWIWEKDSEQFLPLPVSVSYPIALGISGTSEQGAHILGSNIHSTRLSALVVHPSAASADAYSTALFVDGMERAQEKWNLDTQGSEVEPGLACIDQGGLSGPDFRWNGIIDKVFPNLKSVFNTAMISLVVGTAFFMGMPLSKASDEADTAIDLSSMGASETTFNPYNFTRNFAWALLPLLGVALVLWHLKRYRASRRPFSASNIPGTRPEGVSFEKISIPNTKGESSS